MSFLTKALVLPNDISTSCFRGRITGGGCFIPNVSSEGFVGHACVFKERENRSRANIALVPFNISDVVIHWSDTSPHDVSFTTECDDVLRDDDALFTVGVFREEEEKHADDILMRRWLSNNFFPLAARQLLILPLIRLANQHPKKAFILHTYITDEVASTTQSQDIQGSIHLCRV